MTQNFRYNAYNIKTQQINANIILSCLDTTAINLDGTAADICWEQAVIYVRLLR